MKEKIILKSLFVLIGLLFLQFSLQAQDAPPITVNVGTAGTLSSLIPSNKKFEITNLTITGNLNGTDIRYIREMAGRNISGSSTNGKLSILNLADANIEGREIGYSAFYGCTRLTSITIPNSVTSIGENAFNGCTGLTSITIPNSVTSIRYSTFDGCTRLTSVIIPNSVTEIGGFAFHGCTGLTSIAIPNSVTSIGSYAFASCTGLTSITIPNSVTSIGGFAFRGCTGLTSIAIGNSVRTIGERAFQGCSSLASVNIPPSVISIGREVFEGTKINQKQDSNHSPILKKENQNTQTKKRELKKDPNFKIE